MIRCVAYYGGVENDPSPGEIERIAEGVRIRNVALGITGCLFHFDGHFVHVLEGRVDHVGRLYETLTSGERQPNLIGLTDHIVQARAYSNWSIKRFAPRDFGAGSASRQCAACRPVEPFDEAQDGELAILAQRYARKFAHRIPSGLRVVPLQPRAVKTVDRLLDATAAMVARERSLDALTLEAIAAQAGVTQQSTYRYFANVEDLIRTTVRRNQAQWYGRFLAHIMRERFASDADIAQAIVAHLVQTYEAQLGAAGRLTPTILRRYHEIDYDAAWTLAVALSEQPAADGGAPVRAGDAAALAAGLVALWAVAKSLVLREAAQLRRPAVHRMLAEMFLAALADGQAGRP